MKQKKRKYTQKQPSYITADGIPQQTFLQSDPSLFDFKRGKRTAKKELKQGGGATGSSNDQIAA